ncbi:MAG: ferredoxin family protein [Acidobacteriota bacterium]
MPDSATLRIVMYEGSDSRPLPESGRFAILKGLIEKGYAVSRTTGVGKVAPADDNPLLVLGCFDREDLPGQADADVPVLFRDIEGLTIEQIVETVEKAEDDLDLSRRQSWKPWFPVIDYDRCTNCLQCLTFCLFDVYGLSAHKKIEVRNHNKCKTDCPACSRVCPEVAILFPKYRSGPINGDLVSDADVNREKMKVDISALLGGDIYATLRERSEKAKSRFSKERDESRALRERRRCLKALKAAGDISEDVLMSLPDLEDIESRAAQVLAQAGAGERDE